MVCFGNLQDGVVVVLDLIDQMEADTDDQSRDDRLYETPVLYYN